MTRSAVSEPAVVKPDERIRGKVIFYGLVRGARDVTSWERGSMEIN